MKKQNLIINGLLHAVGTTAYIGLVVFFMSHANQWFGAHDTPLTGMVAIMFFVFSAAITASLVFLRPILWYVDGKKHEAVTLLTWTLIFFFVLMLIVFAYVAAVQ